MSVVGGRPPAGLGRAGLLAGSLSGESDSSRSVRGCCWCIWRSTSGEAFFSVRAGVLHIGEERPHEPIPGFPRDSGVFLERRFSADGLPCAEGPALHMGGFQQR